MEKLATDIYTFAELRKNGFTYTDKYDLAMTRLIKVGVAFSSEHRTITEIKIRE